MKKICSTKDVCFPFNVSKIDVEMRKLNPLYSISNTPFDRFSILVQQMVQEGHCKVGPCGGGPLNCVDSKYARAKNPKFEKVLSSEEDVNAVEQALRLGKLKGKFWDPTTDSVVDQHQSRSTSPTTPPTTPPIQTLKKPDKGKMQSQT
jgi:hypothetical protein